MTSQAAILLEMRKKDTSHILHLILTICTAGAWVLIWILCALSNGIENAKLDRKINKLLAAGE